MSKDLKLVDKISPTHRVKSLRKAALDYSRDVAEYEHTKGVFISMSDQGSIGYHCFGMGRSEAISTLEQVKYMIMQQKWGGS